MLTRKPTETETSRSTEKLHHELNAARAALEQSNQALKRTQSQLIQQEKMVSLGELTAGIAHEIKNPLNFINNFAELNIELADELREALQNGEDLDTILSDLKQNAQVIAQHGKRADRVVNAMMQHASSGTGIRELVDINQLVSEHIDLAYHGSPGHNPTHVSKHGQDSDFSVEIIRDLDADAGVIELVPQEIGRVVLNLLSNAFDTVQERSQAAEEGYQPKVQVSTSRSNGHVEVRITDNGSGISPEIREKIFEPFFTTKPTGSGTGLGLSLSYDIVTQGHGGTLMVESREGRGAIFIITLPA